MRVWWLEGEVSVARSFGLQGFRGFRTEVVESL